MVTFPSLFILSSCTVHNSYLYAGNSLCSCVVPEVHLESSVLEFQHCYLGSRYERPIGLINNTNLPACYGLLAQVKCLELYYPVVMNGKS